MSKAGNSPPLVPNKNVLVVFHEDVLGGATLSVLRMVPMLAQHGWRFSFWVDRPSSLFDELKSRNLEVYGRPRPIAYSAAALRQPPGVPQRVMQTPLYLRDFARLLSEIDPSLVHVNSFFGLAEAVTARATGRATLLHTHEMIPAGWKGTVGRRVAHRVAHTMVAVSRASGAQFAIDGASPSIVYEAAPVPDQPVQVRANPNPFTVGTVGVISTRKGSDLFVEAAHRVRIARPDIKFQMVGAATDALETDWARTVLASAKSIGVSHTERADVNQAFRRWDAFALPSRRDPFPIAMLEAMAAGLPVIGTRVDGIAEQLIDGAGIVVEPDDPDDLANAVCVLADQPREQREALGASARRRVTENFTIEHQVDAMERCYQDTLVRAYS